MTRWQPIKNLPQNWHDMAHAELGALAQVWQGQRQSLEQSQTYQTFLEQMRRKIAIETGIIERLYSIDRGITQLLIERGIDEALLQHGTTDEPMKVVALIRDHEAALDGIFNFVGSQRPLSESYIRQLHQLLTRHQDTTEAVDQFGNIGSVRLLRGEYKRHPNNPTRADGVQHVYCPPEQVAPQMEQLLKWHVEHEAQHVTPDVEAAWLHHCFTQIHPFQDGNGRVARMLASLVFIKAGWFPLVITRDEREAYITALETADTGDLQPLIDLFARMQQQVFLSVLSLSEDVLLTQIPTSVTGTLTAAAAQLLQTRQWQEAPDYQRASSITEALTLKTENKLNQLAKEIKTALTNIVPNSATEIFQRLNGYERFIWGLVQRLAKEQDFQVYHRDSLQAMRIIIPLNRHRTHLVLAFYVPGREYRGVMMCSVFLLRELWEEDSPIPGEIVEEAIINPVNFVYSHHEPTDKILKRFEKWLESSLLAGLEFWRKNL